MSSTVYSAFQSGIMVNQKDLLGPHTVKDLEAAGIEFPVPVPPYPKPRSDEENLKALKLGGEALPVFTPVMIYTIYLIKSIRNILNSRAPLYVDVDDEDKDSTHLRLAQNALCTEIQRVFERAEDYKDYLLGRLDPKDYFDRNQEDFFDPHTLKDLKAVGIEFPVPVPPYPKPRSDEENIQALKALKQSGLGEALPVFTPVMMYKIYLTKSIRNILNSRAPLYVDVDDEDKDSTHLRLAQNALCTEIQSVIESAEDYKDSLLKYLHLG